MFNFKTLKLTKRCDAGSGDSSFVGIRRNENGEMEFRLPHGFDEFPTKDFNATKDFFFKMYRTFKKFERDSTRKIIDPDSNAKDQIQKEKDGYRFKNKEDNDVVLYSKIALIENLLDVYRDLALDLMERRIGADEKVDYSKIDRYLDRAIYLPKDVIYIDEMDLPRQTLRYEATTLIDLFCFIVSELQNELEEDIAPRVQELAYRFSEQHLSHEESLFNEETFESTIRTLKGALDDIDKRTAYKDEDYWRLYDAIEMFLYGELDMENPDENGIYWGISNFWSVWEDMCNTYAFENFDVFYADTHIVFNGKQIQSGSQKSDFKNPFFIKFRDKQRKMRPDLIHKGAKTQEWIFDEFVKIDIKKTRGARIDFEVELLDKKGLLAYKGFCSNLKSAKVSGIRIVGENSFKNYPLSELTEQKNTIKKIHKSKSFFRLIDWKYMTIDCFTRYDSKVEIDIIKQLCYEFSLKKSQQVIKTDNQFVIPWFYNEITKDIGDVVDSKILYFRLRENQIKIFKADFSKIQQIYLTHD